MGKYFTYCGLYCGACIFGIATETGTLKETAEKFQKTEAEVHCLGCKAAQIEDCEFRICCSEKGFESCAECPDMPCEKVHALCNDEWEHHSVVITNLNRIKEIGKAAWLKEQLDEWKCKNCGERTMWYQKVCSKCRSSL